MDHSVEAIIQRQRMLVWARTYIYPALGRLAAIGVGVALGFAIATI